MENRMILSRKILWTRPWKRHWRHQSIQCCRLVTVTKESSPIPVMITHTGNTSSLQWQEVGRRKGVKEVSVIWTYSVALVWIVWFVSKRFVNEIIIIKPKNPIIKPTNTPQKAWYVSLRVFLCRLTVPHTWQRLSTINQLLIRTVYW